MKFADTAGTIGNIGRGVRTLSCLYNLKDAETPQELCEFLSLTPLQSFPVAEIRNTKEKPKPRQALAFSESCVHTLVRSDAFLDLADCKTLVL